MKRIYIALIAFTVVVSASVCGYFLCQKSADNLSFLMESAAYGSDDSFDINGAAENIKREWSISSILFKATQNQKDYTEIDYLINKLQSLAKAKDYEGFRESCIEAVFRLRFIADNEHPNIENIF